MVPFSRGIAGLVDSEKVKDSRVRGSGGDKHLARVWSPWKRWPETRETLAGDFYFLP